MTVRPRFGGVALYIDASNSAPGFSIVAAASACGARCAALADLSYLGEAAGEERGVADTRRSCSRRLPPLRREREEPFYGPGALALREYEILASRLARLYI